MIVHCEICGKEQNVPPTRAKRYHTCSYACGGIRVSAPNNVTCCVCGKEAHMKPHRLNRIKGEWTCSKECFRIRQQTYMSGERNHQYGLKGPANATFSANLQNGEYVRMSDGYIIVYHPDNPHADKSGWIRQHRVIAEECYPDKNSRFMESINGSSYLNRTAIVHHMDGNKTNNAPENLAVVSLAEHSHIHNTNMNLEMQNLLFGVVKVGELRENPEVDNPDPSLSNSLQQ